MKTFCCRFILENEFCTSSKISSKELTKEEAMAWAINQVNKNEDYLGVDTVYEVED